MVPDLLWDDVKNFFDPDVMGPLPDVSVADTSIDDWQVVLDLVCSRGWACEYSEDGAVLRLPRAGVMMARSIVVARRPGGWRSRELHRLQR